MKQTNFNIIASVKKFSTQASKGGSIILVLELPATDENAMLAMCQSKDCAVNLAFDNESVENAKGQGELDLNLDNKELVDSDVDFQYINKAGAVVNAHLLPEKK